MEIVVCDTSVWYHIAQGLIPEAKLKGKRLIATYVTIAEIASTQNLTNDVALVEDVIAAIFKYRYKFMPLNQFEHIMKLLWIPVYFDYQSMNRLLSGFSYVLENSLVPHLSEEIKKDVQKEIDKIEFWKSDVAKDINVKILAKRKLIKQNQGKLKLREMNFKNEWKSFIVKVINNYSKEHFDKEYQISLNDDGWKNISFFLDVIEEFFKNLVLQGNGKFHNNDSADLFNMVYVHPGLKYWTRDKKWVNIFKQNSLLSNYAIAYEG